MWLVIYGYGGVGGGERLIFLRGHVDTFLPGCGNDKTTHQKWYHRSVETCMQDMTREDFGISDCGGLES